MTATHAALFILALFIILLAFTQRHATRPERNEAAITAATIAAVTLALALVL